MYKTPCERLTKSGGGRSDPVVYLFYRSDRLGRWICAVAKQLNDEGFLITAYPTDAIKEGERILRK